jgi:hypothetical protein
VIGQLGELQKVTGEIRESIEAGRKAMREGFDAAQSTIRLLNITNGELRECIKAQGETIEILGWLAAIGWVLAIGQMVLGVIR